MNGNVIFLGVSALIASFLLGKVAVVSTREKLKKIEKILDSVPLGDRTTATLSGTGHTITVGKYILQYEMTSQLSGSQTITAFLKNPEDCALQFFFQRAELVYIVIGERDGLATDSLIARVLYADKRTEVLRRAALMRQAFLIDINGSTSVVPATEEPP